jgi:hypothetical protein
VLKFSTFRACLLCSQTDLPGASVALRHSISDAWQAARLGDHEASTPLTK